MEMILINLPNIFKYIINNFLGFNIFYIDGFTTNDL